MQTPKSASGFPRRRAWGTDGAAHEARRGGRGAVDCLRGGATGDRASPCPGMHSVLQDQIVRQDDTKLDDAKHGKQEQRNGYGQFDKCLPTVRPKQ